MLRLIAYAHDDVRRFPVGGGELLVGSEPACDIYLPYTGVARQHARIRRQGTRLHIEDLGTRRGLQVNGERVKEALLEVLDEIRLGSITLLLEDVRKEPDAAVEEAEPRRELQPMTAARMTEHLASLSQWVLADTESRTTLEALVQQVLLELGGGVFLLLQEDGDETAVRFLVATDSDWLPAAESLFEQVRPLRSRSRHDSGSFSGSLTGELCQIHYHSVRGLDREYLAVAAMLGEQDDWSPAASIRAMADLLILGLVHHVGRYEPILPGVGSRKGLTLAPGLVVGESETMAKVMGHLSALADSDAHVLLRGEDGCGRELLARTLHLSGPQRHGPFVIASCGGANPVQIEADLFGAEVAGREAPVRRPGRFQLANGGTLLLQDIEELPLPLQAKLVRFLRSGEVELAGGLEPEPSKVRIISCSRGPLEPFVARDGFRVDLAYRLSQLAIDVPPLRERRDDLPLLIQSYVNRFCHESGKRAQGITVKAMTALMAYDYPGNLIELENLCRQMVHLCPNGKPMDIDLLPLTVRSPKVRQASRVDAGSDLALDRLVAACEETAIREALSRSRGNKSRAARLLGLSRNGLSMKMERYGIRL